jgi:hypothetical protein
MNYSLVLLTIQYALLGKVTLNLRAVYVIFENDVIHLQFYYDSPPNEDEAELASLADTEFIADFPDNKTTCTISTLPFPKPIPNKGLCAYFRYENTYEN